MTSTKKQLNWYLIIYTSHVENGGAKGETMDVLGEDWAEASRIAGSCMESGDEIMSMGLMGTQSDYELYEKYLLKREEVEFRQQALYSSVTGESTCTGEMSVTSIPFSDDDVIELT